MKKIETPISDDDMKTLIDKINETRDFHAERSFPSNGIRIFSESGFFGIPTHHIKKIEYNNSWIDIETDYMSMTLFTTVAIHHITFFKFFKEDTVLNTVSVCATMKRRRKVSNVPATCETCKKTLKNVQGLKLHEYLKHKKED